MSTLARHYSARYLVHLLATLLILSVFVLIVELLLDLDEILAVESTPAGILQFVTIRITAFYLPHLIPLSSFIGAYLTTALAARDHEITAMKAGGISPLILTRAILTSTLAVIFAGFLVNETLVRSAQESLQFRSNETPSSLSLRHGRIWYHTGLYIYNIESLSGNEVSGVRIYKKDARGRLQQTIQADRGRQVESQLWAFDNATVRDFDPSRPRTPPNIQRTDQIQLLLDPNTSPGNIRAKLLLKPIWALLASPVKDDPVIQAEIHKRISEAPLLLALTLLAIPLGFSVQTGRSLARPALEGALTISVFFAFREYGAELGSLGEGLGILWGSLTALCLYTGTRLYNSDS